MHIRRRTGGVAGWAHVRGRPRPRSRQPRGYAPRGRGGHLAADNRPSQEKGPLRSSHVVFDGTSSPEYLGVSYQSDSADANQWMVRIVALGQWTATFALRADP